MSSNKFDGVTLLITHFNRSASLERLLSAFKDLNCVFEEIVVSDDCSNPEHQFHLNSLRLQYNFRLIGAKANSGLANNINKGQDAVTSPYTVYVQEDFIPTNDFPLAFQAALDIMTEKPELDLIRFYSYVPYPYTIPYRDGFSEMHFKAWGSNYYKVYAYSDHPHLRRSNFLEKFGRYVEGIPSDRAEYRMCISFIQHGGKGLLYDNFKQLFEQYNPATEPSTVIRRKWTLSSNFAIRTLRYVYRQLKYNYDIQLSKSNVTNYTRR